MNHDLKSIASLAEFTLPHGGLNVGARNAARVCHERGTSKPEPTSPP